MTLLDISESIRWTKDKMIYFQTNNSEYSLLIEYLNNLSISGIDIEVNKLTNFSMVLDTNNKEHIENYILTSLYGFNEYPDGIYAYIAGATDFSITVLYDISNNNIFLKHVYGEPNEKYFIQIPTLVSLLKKVKSINILLTSPIE